MTDIINTAAIAAQPAPAKRSSSPKIAKAVLTDKKVKALQKTKAAPGKRLVVWDGAKDGFAVRITDKGYCSYVYGARYPGSKSWTLREIGPCDKMTLEAARTKAEGWIALLQKNIDPRAEADRLEKEEARKRGNTFSSIAEEYILDKVIGDDPAHPLQRNGNITARTIRKVFVAAWKDRPISGIGRDDILTIIRAGKRRIKVGKRHRGGPAAARASLDTIKAMFKWCLNQSYGLERNVARDIEPKDIIGDKIARSRILTDDELRALWRAADQSSYPVEQSYQLLMLTGLRLNEVCGARRGREEFDPRKAEWTIPASRMKGKNSGSKQARPFLVPLNATMMQIIDSVPKFNDSNTGFLFTTTRGRAKFRISSKVKKAIDALMLAELRKIAAERGDDPKSVVLPGWTNHDIRRTVRSRLSALKDADGRKLSLEVKEACLAHVRGGIVGTYDPSDLYSLSDEKREALELWAARLHEIVNPPTPDDGNVVHPRFRKAAS